MKSLYAILAVLLGLLGCAQMPSLLEHGYDSGHRYEPPNGFVPNAETATQIADVVLVAIYGQELINQQKPFRIDLEDDVWRVRGAPPEGLGGTFFIAISKKDARILRVTHGK